MANLIVTVIPADINGNFIPNLDLRLRQTDDSGTPSLTDVVQLTETSAGSGVYESAAIADVTWADITSDSDPSQIAASLNIGNYEVWKYENGSPVEKMVSNYMIGTSRGVIQILNQIKYELTQKASSSHSHNVADLADVIISSVGTSELLMYNGTEWINRTLAEAGISAVGHTHDTYTKAESDSLLAGKSDTSHTHTEYKTESEIVSLIEKAPSAPPSLTGNGMEFDDLSDIAGISDNVNIYQSSGASRDFVFMKLGINLRNFTSEGGPGYILDVNQEIGSSSGDIDSAWTNSYLWYNTVSFLITSVEWDTLNDCIKFNLDASPDLTGESGGFYIYSGDSYEINLIPKYNSVKDPSKALRYLVPAIVDSVPQEFMYVPVIPNRPYFIEVKTIYSGNKSSAKTMDYTALYSQGTSNSSNVILTAAEFGITVNMSKTGSWATADSFELCWTTSGTASFGNTDHRKAISVSTVFDIPLAQEVDVSVAVRPLKNGVVIAPAVVKSITSGAGGSISEIKSISVDVSLTTTDLTQEARTVLKKAFKNAVRILSATFVATGNNGDTSKFRVYQLNNTSNIVASQFTNTTSLNIQYTSNLNLDIRIEGSVYEIAADFYDPAGSNNFGMVGRLEIFYKDIS